MSKEEAFASTDPSRRALLWGRRGLRVLLLTPFAVGIWLWILSLAQQTEGYGDDNAIRRMGLLFLLVPLSMLVMGLRALTFRGATRPSKKQAIASTLLGVLGLPLLPVILLALTFGGGLPPLAHAIGTSTASDSCTGSHLDLRLVPVPAGANRTGNLTLDIHNHSDQKVYVESLHLGNGGQTASGSENGKSIPAGERQVVRFDKLFAAPWYDLSVVHRYSWQGSAQTVRVEMTCRLEVAP